jgi:hypothetical protein
MPGEKPTQKPQLLCFAVMVFVRPRGSFFRMQGAFAEIRRLTLAQARMLLPGGTLIAG